MAKRLPKLPKENTYATAGEAQAWIDKGTQDDFGQKSINGMTRFDEQLRKIALDVDMHMMDADLAVINILKAWRDVSPIIAFGLGIKWYEKNKRKRDARSKD